MRRLLFLAVAAVAATTFVYGQTISYGFVWDDYHFVRPHTRADLLLALTGTWDPTGIENPFYRPLTALLTALRFDLFGINPVPYRWLTLAMFATAASMCGAFVWSITRSVWSATIATVWFCAYPTFAHSLVAWITNQFHLVELLVVLAALLWWWFCKNRSFGWWLPLLGLQLTAVLLKEDAVMLAPAVLALHVLYWAIIDRSLPRPPGAWLALSVALAVAFVIGRSIALGGVGGYGVPSLDRMRFNYQLGLGRVFFVYLQRVRPGQTVVSWLVLVVPILAVGPLLFSREARQLRFVAAAGLALLFLFNAPFVMTTKYEQYHLVSLGAALWLAACAGALVRVPRPRWARNAVGALLLAAAAPMAMTAADAAADFAPCGRQTLFANRQVREWAVVPQEIRRVLPTDAESCRNAPKRLSDLPLVAFGLWDLERNHRDETFRWTTGSVTLMVEPSAREVAVPMRASLGRLGGQPATVQVTENGLVNPLLDLTLTDGEWRCLRVPIDRKRISRLRRMSVVELRISPVWTPSQLDPASNDSRVLGVQFGPLDAGCLR